jgi:hypothetical protein
MHSKDRLTSIDRLLVGYGVGSIESYEQHRTRSVNTG